MKIITCDVWLHTLNLPFRSDLLNLSHALHQIKLNYEPKFAAKTFRLYMKCTPPTVLHFSTHLHPEPFAFTPLANTLEKQHGVALKGQLWVSRLWMSFDINMTHNLVCHICTHIETHRARLVRANVLWVQIKVPLKFISIELSLLMPLNVILPLIQTDLPNVIIWIWISSLFLRELACDHTGRMNYDSDMNMS